MQHGGSHMSASIDPAVQLLEAWRPEAEPLRVFFRNVWPLYVHEIAGFDTDFYRLDEHGRWQPDIVEDWIAAVTPPANLREDASSRYGGQPFQRTYVVACEGRVVGFVCLGLAPFRYMVEDADVCLAELFLTRAARGGGLGERALALLLPRHPGRWQLRVIHDNARALAFWSKALPRARVTQLKRSTQDKDVCWSFSVDR